MNSILNKDNLGATKDWKFLRDDLLSIFAADDDRFNKEYKNGEIEQVFDQMAEEYLDGFTVSGFCLDTNDSVIDVVALITVLAGASIFDVHPFGWDLNIDHDDKANPCGILEPDNVPGGGWVPDIFMIDFSKAENFNEEFKRTLNEYMTLFGYGHMDTVYEQRLVYISKFSYANRTKDVSDIIDRVNEKFYTLKFEPYRFDLLVDTCTHITAVIASILLTEIAIARICDGKETFRVNSSGNTRYDDLMRSYMCTIANGITGDENHKVTVLCNRSSEPEYTEFEIRVIEKN